MKLRTRYRGALLVTLFLAYLSVSVCGAALTAQLSLAPAPIARGETLTISVLLDNGEGTDRENTTLYVPLPLGIDQWKAKIRVDGGLWMEYPANGLIELDSILASAERVVDIQVPIELASSATLTITAQWLDSSGILAQAMDWVNVLPSVDAGPDLIADLGTPIALETPSASDGGGSVVGYQWTDLGAGGSFDDRLTLHPIYTPPALSGVIELSLTVTDEDGGESTDSLRIRVNAVPAIDIGDDLEVQEGSHISIGQASASDSDGWIALITWSDSGAGGTFLPSNDVINPVYLVPEIEGCSDGQIVLTVEVMDDGGATSTDALILYVTNVNELPTVYLPEEFDVASGQQADLSAIASDEDGWIEGQKWEQINGTNVELHMGSQEQHVWFEAPDVDARMQLIFRFEATDNCGGLTTGNVTVTVVPHRITDDPPGDDDPPIVDVPLVDGSLRIDLGLFDARGLPLSPFDSPRVGDVITVRVSVVNTGKSELVNLWMTVSNGESGEMIPSHLGQWDNATGTIEWLVEASDLVGGLKISASATGTDELGRTVTAESTFQFLVPIQDTFSRLSLKKTASVSQASAGDIIGYAYTVTNTGSSDLVGLTLHDDELGWIELPDTVLRGNESIEIDVAYTVHGADLPGPLVNWAVATGFTLQGERVKAEASTSVELLETPSEGGGGAYSQLSDRIVISEIAWAGSGMNPADEWIELANIGNGPIDLTGWHIMWYEKAGVLPPLAQWHSVELSGEIQPLSDRAKQPSPIDFTVREDRFWSVRDPRWGVESSHSGFHLLERGNDDVVANVAAGTVYGDAANPYYDLPDSGAALFLVDAAGTIVDSANAQYADRTGWPAGNMAGATMERINLEQGDFDANWQTSSGVLTYGIDEAGHGLVATAGMPNSLALDVLLQNAAAQLIPAVASGLLHIPIPDTTASDRVRIQMTALAGSLAAGGGGASGAPRLSTIRSSEGLTLQVDLESASRGGYFVWITLGSGQVLVLPIRI